MSVVVDLVIEVKGPVLTAGLETPAYGVDTGFLRDAAGRFAISGTLVKGVVREILEAMSAVPGSLLSDTEVKEWLGRKSDAEENTSGVGTRDPHRSRVRFSDFVLDNGKAHSLTRIKIDEGTGSVERGMLQVLESPLAIGEPGKFRGQLRLDLDDASANKARDWILKALRIAPALGGVKSAGFGWIKNVRTPIAGDPELPTTAIKAPQINVAPPDLATAERVRYALVIQKPFLVASEAISGNLFKGSVVIPGAAVKGALADKLKRTGTLTSLADALDKVIFRHAKPSMVKDGIVAVRPRAIPWSTYSVEGWNKKGEPTCELVDALATPVETQAGKIVSFRGDWKDGGKAIELALGDCHHTYKPAYDVRTRTAIDYRRGTAKTNSLFTQISVIPDGHHVWAGELAKGAATQDEFRKIVEALSGGLDCLGKTGAAATVVILAAAPAEVSKSAAAADGTDRSTWHIVLETDALLHGPGAVHAPKQDEEPDPVERLRLQYRNYFAECLGVAPDEIALDCFAHHRWAGHYHAQRFPHFTDRYFPHLITEACTVFQISVPAACDSAILKFRQSGLPLPKTVRPNEIFQYQRSPFNPENGYGEVSITRVASPSATAGRSPS